MNRNNPIRPVVLHDDLNIGIELDFWPVSVRSTDANTLSSYLRGGPNLICQMNGVLQWSIEA